MRGIEHPLCTWGSLVEVEPTTCPHRRPGRGRSSFWPPRPRRDGRNRSGRVRHAGAPVPRLRRPPGSPGPLGLSPTRPRWDGPECSTRSGDDHAGIRSELRAASCERVRDGSAATPTLRGGARLQPPAASSSRGATAAGRQSRWSTRRWHLAVSRRV